MPNKDIMESLMKRLCALVCALVAIFMLGAAKVDVDATLETIKDEMREEFEHPCSIQKSTGLFSKFTGADLWIAACDKNEYGPVIYEFIEKVAAAFPGQKLTVSVDFFSDADCSDLVLGFTHFDDSKDYGTVFDYGNTKKAFNYKILEDFMKDYPSVDTHVRMKTLTEDEQKIYNAVEDYSAEFPEATDEELDNYICGKFGITPDAFNELYFSAVAKMVF